MSRENKIADSVFIADGVKLVGNYIEIGELSSVWFNAVVRSSEAEVIIGERSNVQDLCVLHAEPGNDIHIGNGVTIGHAAIVHGCTIEDGALIGMGATVMNHAVVGKNSVVAAGALVTENTIIPENSLVVGAPAKVRRTLTPEELERYKWNAEEYVRESRIELAKEK